MTHNTFHFLPNTGDAFFYSMVHLKLSLIRKKYAVFIFH